MYPYLEILIVILAFRLMYAAAATEGRSGGLWLLITLAWLVGLRWLLGGLLGGTTTALVAMVACYSTMFAANLLRHERVG